MPDISHEITIANIYSDNPVPANLDPQTLGAGTTLSDLDRIGLGIRITRTTRASEMIREGEQPSTSGVVGGQPASISQANQDLLGDADLGDIDILDIDVDGSEDFSDIDPALADHLLGDSPEDMIKNWVAGCYRGRTSEQLADGSTGRADPSAASKQAAPDPSASEGERAPEEMAATEEGLSTAEAQPGLTRYTPSRSKHTVKIEKVGEFR